MGIIIGLVIIIIIINQLSVKTGFIDLNYALSLDKEKAEIGEPISVYSTVENRKWLTVSFLTIIESFPQVFSPCRNTYALFMLPFQRVKRRYVIQGKKRGLYVFKDTQQILGDFIGLADTERYVNYTCQMVILPKPLMLEEHLQPYGSMTGDWSVKRWILDDPLMTIGLREYTGNEPMKYIHWPSTARYGQMMVRQFDFTTDRSVMIVLNCEALKPIWVPIEEDLIERCIGLTRGLMMTLEEAHTPYGFTTNIRSVAQEGIYTHPGLGAQHLDDLVYQLGTIDIQKVMFFEPILDNIQHKKGHYTTVVVITPRLLDTYIEPLNALNKSVVKTVVISLESDGFEHLNASILKLEGGQP